MEWMKSRGPLGVTYSVTHNGESIPFLYIYAPLFTRRRMEEMGRWDEIAQRLLVEHVQAARGNRPMLPCYNERVITAARQLFSATQ